MAQFQHFWGWMYSQIPSKWSPIPPMVYFGSLGTPSQPMLNEDEKENVAKSNQILDFVLLSDANFRVQFSDAVFRWSECRLEKVHAEQQRILRKRTRKLQSSLAARCTSFSRVISGIWQGHNSPHWVQTQTAKWEWWCHSAFR